MSLATRDHELLAMQPIMNYFPVEFSKDAVWVDLDGICACCEQVVPRVNVRGIVTRPIPGVAVVEAVAICGPCNVVSRIDYRLHSDMRLTGLQGGKWRTWTMVPNLWQRIKFKWTKLAGVKKAE